MNSNDVFERRIIVGGFGLAALLQNPILAHAAQASGAPVQMLDLTTPDANVIAMAKITATLEPDAHTHGYYTGVLMGVVPGEEVRELVGVIGMSTQRLRPAPEKSGYQLLQKECGFFTDIKTGQVLDRWMNPYLKEEVAPFHIANPAVNRWIVPLVPDSRFYDRAEGAERPPTPFVLPWRLAGDRLMLEQRTHFWAENPLNPSLWKRESSGPRIQISDMMSYNVSWRALNDPKKLHVDHWGHWVHVRPWQPWMLMADRPGHCLYSAMTGSAATLADVPAEIVALVKERLPEFLLPPTEVRPSEPSMKRFIRERKPAPAE